MLPGMLSGPGAELISQSPVPNPSKQGRSMNWSHEHQARPSMMLRKHWDTMVSLESYHSEQNTSQIDDICQGPLHDLRGCWACKRRCAKALGRMHCGGCQSGVHGGLGFRINRVETTGRIWGGGRVLRADNVPGNRCSDQSFYSSPIETQSGSAGISGFWASWG